MTLASQPLGNDRHENFAQLKALGVESSAAWIDTAPQGSWPNRKSAAVSGHRVSVRPEVKARIKYLQGCRSERRSAPLRLDSAADAIGAMNSLTASLSAFYARLRAEGATEDELAAMRALTSTHSQRALSIADLAAPSAPVARTAALHIPEGASHVCRC